MASIASMGKMPRNSEARATLALAYDRNGQYDAAIQAAQEAINLDKANAEAYAFLAEAIADKSPLDKRAKEAIQEALELDNRSVFAHRNHAYILETERDYRKAAAAYLRAIALAPALAPLYMDLGRVYYLKLNKFDDAISALRRATELESQQPSDLYGTGALLLQQGRMRPPSPNYKRPSAWTLNMPPPMVAWGGFITLACANTRRQFPSFRRPRNWVASLLDAWPHTISNWDGRTNSWVSARMLALIFRRPRTSSPASPIRT